MAAKDRSTHGSLNPMAKLSEDDAVAIFIRYRMGGISMKSLGRAYGVSASQVHAIVHRNEWARATASQ